MQGRKTAKGPKSRIEHRSHHRHHLPQFIPKRVDDDEPAAAEREETTPAKKRKQNERGQKAHGTAKRAEAEGEIKRGARGIVNARQLLLCPRSKGGTPSKTMNRATQGSEIKREKGIFVCGYILEYTVQWGRFRIC